MTKIQTIILMSASALALAACDDTTKAPTPEVEATVAAPEANATAPALDANAAAATAEGGADAAAEGLDETGNPTGPKGISRDQPSAR